MALNPGFNPFMVSRLTFPITSYLYNRKYIRRDYLALTKSEYLSADLLREIQLNKLKRVIEHAYAYVPFYQKRFKEIGLQPQDIKQLKDMELLPPVTRQEIIDHHKSMVDIRLQNSIPFADARKGDPGTPIPFSRFKKHKLVRNTSSGSTGAPTIFYEDGSRTALNWVHEMRLKSWFGVKPGDKEVRMVRLSTDYSPKNKTIRMRKLLWNQLLVPGTNLADADYQIALDAILEYKPKVIYGFPSALSGLAEYAKKTNRKIGQYRPAVMIGWAGPVYEHEEKVMREVFQCEVSNNYGAREVGHVAGRCSHGEFHINQENFLVEIDESTNQSGEQNSGEILVTPIDIGPMPFLRYRMGDIGSLESKQCQCGRTLQILTDFLGRTGEVFITKDGRMISPNFWCRFFFLNQYSNAVRRFQVIYKKDRNLKIKIEKDVKFNPEIENFIKEGVKKNFSEETRLELEYLPKIEPQISGKYQMVVNEADTH